MKVELIGKDEFVSLAHGRHEGDRTVVRWIGGITLFVDGKYLSLAPEIWCIASLVAQLEEEGEGRARSGAIASEFLPSNGRDQGPCGWKAC
jgi:hypothetical protein